MDTLVAFLYVTGLALSLSRLPASLLHNSLLTRPSTLLTHPQSFDLISKTSIAGVFAVLLRFAQPACSSGIRKAASIKRVYFCVLRLHTHKRRSSIKEARNED